MPSKVANFSLSICKFQSPIRILTVKKDEIEKRKTILECIQASNKYSDPSRKYKMKGNK